MSGGQEAEARPPRVLVTGCSSGLGRMTARHLAAHGMTVFAAMRTVSAAEELADGGRIHVLPLDMGSDSSVADAYAAIDDLAGGVDAVVANAGVELRGPLEATSAEELAWQLETNVVGTHRVIRAALPAMRARGQGRVVVVSSIVGRAARPLLGAYSASKFALEGLSEALHLEMSPFGVTVSVLEPGRFPSRLSLNGRDAEGWKRDGGPYDAQAATVRDAVAALEPPGYDPRPESVAEAVRRLLMTPRPPFRMTVGLDADATATLLGRHRFDRYARLFAPATGQDGDPATPSGLLDEEVTALTSREHLAVLTTLLPGGRPQTHVVWIDHDGRHLLVNTELHRRKYLNMKADPHVTVTLIDRSDPHHFVEIRGRVAGFEHEPDAREHIDALSRKYRGHDYDPATVRSARVVARIAPVRIVRVSGSRIRSSVPGGPVTERTE
ncbi:SDR family NAD(P)-dependent oxidoreductase [Nonomuraea angiospora]|uniref:SDR family NAD(P)-dependent oxidoreductase n=1 Tax=Nonomuraea angiospora TaxID=46172 RepID=UPI0029BE69E9|nr:SDR family NAD(P)-dependent oxidoreductase [Nonomuraea angiospora]MDX3103358.1 SDR family NAD(P)-dependent oxidoreductase [Nonomuraea angiospora]